MRPILTLAVCPNGKNSLSPTCRVIGSGCIEWVDSGVAAGGVSYVLPSAVTVLFLNIFRSMPQYAGYAFIFGEGLRIVLALVLMVAFFALYHQELRFIPFLLGLLATSHVIFFIFWKAKYHVKRK